jgi:hypothetical protein
MDVFMGPVRCPRSVIMAHGICIYPRQHRGLTQTSWDIITDRWYLINIIAHCANEFTCIWRPMVGGLYCGAPLFNYFHNSLSYSKMIQLIAILVTLFTLCHGWDNEYDKELNVVCPKHLTVSGIRSEHSDATEDRLFDIQCRLTAGARSRCYWSGMFT